MPSYISNSSDRLPSLPWARALGCAVILFFAFVGGLELCLAARGFRHTVQDSESLWQQGRERAGKLGENALILIGASRIQLDLDMDVLRRETGLDPVQLAIDGSSMLPILRGLAGDPAIRGTVLVDYYDSTVSVPEPQDDAAAYQHNYDERQKRPLNGTLVEDWLTERLRRHLRSYADGMNPRQSLLRRVFSSNATPQYLVTLPDRSRIADYTRVQMPNFYLARALRNLGDNFEYPFKTSKDNGERARELESRIAALMPKDNTVFLRVTREMRRMADAIRSRGGEVILVRFPVSGYIREADERRYPRAMFWDRFAKDVASPTLNFADVPGLREFTCPDGSHLDYRSRKAFTEALVSALGLKAPAGASQ